MASDPISKLYERYRSFPGGKNSEDHPRPQNPPSYDRSPRDGALRRNTPQDIEDRPDHSRGRYHNDHANDWVRGRGESGTGKPGFDFGGSRQRKGNKS
jgi:hypothetical protein